jgi:diaminohydroxyphosphoribosylaminopyrimidine deaminase/5-amino-6-(5-phosphoribosylamino)uracil reductase
MPIVLRPTPRDTLLKELALPPPGTPVSPAAARQLAVTVALRGIGKVAPNPLVGCVLVDRLHRFVAAGAHERLGGPHAEVAALETAAAAGLDLAGGTAYVTLEPCAHHGRTPACAPRVATSGLARVVFGVVDPNPKVSGKGAALIAAQGVACEADPAWESDCRALAEIFLHHQTSGRPFVALKAAATLDGVIARAGDRRAWITEPRARAYAHFLRILYDAIAVGRGTLEADDPTLDARDSLVPGRAPRRVVIDPELRALSAQRKLLSHTPEGVLWVARADAWTHPAHAEAVRSLDERGAKRLALAPDASGLLPPEEILAALAREGVTSLLLEGGAGLYAAFLRAGLVDRIHLFQAARLFGSDGATLLASGAGRLSLAAASAIEITTLDDDWVVEARLTDTSRAP